MRLLSQLGIHMEMRFAVHNGIQEFVNNGSLSLLKDGIDFQELLVCVDAELGLVRVNGAEVVLLCSLEVSKFFCL